MGAVLNSLHPVVGYRQGDPVCGVICGGGALGGEGVRLRRGFTIGIVGCGAHGSESTFGRRGYLGRRGVATRGRGLGGQRTRGGNLGIDVAQ